MLIALVRELGNRWRKNVHFGIMAGIMVAITNSLIGDLAALRIFDLSVDLM